MWLEIAVQQHLLVEYEKHRTGRAALNLPSLTADVLQFGIHTRIGPLGCGLNSLPQRADKQQSICRPRRPLNRGALPKRMRCLLSHISQ
jgi:hypothetical protein